MEENKIINFKSEVEIMEDGSLDARKLFKDLDNLIEDTKNRIGWSRLPRHFTPQTVINRTSANYISPTALKGFLNEPAQYLYSMLTWEDKQSATYVGTSFHTLMERFYTLDPNLRDREHFNELMQNVIDEDELVGKALNDFMIYAEGFWSAPDYIKGPKGEMLPMNHKNIKTSLEYFVRDSLTPLGVNMSPDPEKIPSFPTYTLIDRIDFRTVGNEEKIYIIDYKTGMGNPDSYNLGQNGYLPQMIFYKWAVEALYNKPVEAVYLMLPGANDDDHKWVEMNVHSLVEQSKVIENVVYSLQALRKVSDSKIFPHAIRNEHVSSHFKYSVHPDILKEPGTKLPVTFKIDEREFLETALSNEMITELPENIRSIDQWKQLSIENNHAFEESYILEDEAKEEKEKLNVLNKLSGSEDSDDDDDEDW